MASPCSGHVFSARALQSLFSRGAYKALAAASVQSQTAAVNLQTFCQAQRGASYSTSAVMCSASSPVSTTGTPEESVECVVVGGGVVGLAIARQLAMAGREVIIVEAGPTIGTGISSRNSEVIHGGMYYRPGSLKAKLCVEGRRKLYRFCDDHGVVYKKYGKLIVATSEKEAHVLEQLRNRGLENNVEGLRMMHGDEAKELEPNLHCVQALHSPETGIVDSHGLMLACLGDAEDHGAAVAYNSTVISGKIKDATIQIDVCDTASLSTPSSQSHVAHPANQSTSLEETAGQLGDMPPPGPSTSDLPTPQQLGNAPPADMPPPGPSTSDLPTPQQLGNNPPLDPPAPSPKSAQSDPSSSTASLPSPSMRLSAKLFINAAGLEAVPLAHRIVNFPKSHIPRRHLAKGSYFVLSGVSPHPFKRLIYPVPEDGGLGVHVTLDLGGQIKFGPDVEWMPEAPTANGILFSYNYDVNVSLASKFYPEVRKYYPDLPEGTLAPDYSGIRPKISGRGEPAADFLIQGPKDHGVAGLVNLFGIESPGLTSALSIAEYVQQLVDET